jgi:hypothetical protein
VTDAVIDAVIDAVTVAVTVAVIDAVTDAVLRAGDAPVGGIGTCRGRGDKDIGGTDMGVGRAGGGCGVSAAPLALSRARGRRFMHTYRAVRQLGRSGGARCVRGGDRPAPGQALVTAPVWAHGAAPGRAHLARIPASWPNRPDPMRPTRPTRRRRCAAAGPGRPHPLRLAHPRLHLHLHPRLRPHLLRPAC